MHADNGGLEGSGLVTQGNKCWQRKKHTHTYPRELELPSPGRNEGSEGVEAKSCDVPPGNRTRLPPSPNRDTHLRDRGTRGAYA